RPGWPLPTACTKRCGWLTACSMPPAPTPSTASTGWSATFGTPIPPCSTLPACPSTSSPPAKCSSACARKTSDGRWPTAMPNPPALSLLWPEGTRPSQTCTALDPQCVRDLELESTLAAFADSRPGRSSIREVFLTLCTDPAVIAYRQDILDDLWRNPEFIAHLQALLPQLNALYTALIAVDVRRLLIQ